MIHLFEMNGDRLVFDPNSGALHLLDESAYALMLAYLDTHGVRPRTDIIDQLAGRYGDDVPAIADEIDQLVKGGQLFAPPIPFNLSRLYPDQPRIKAMCLHVAHDCNLRCKYCFAGTGDFGTGKRIRMDVETGQKAIDYLIQASGNRENLDIDFFGGEPLMNWPVVVALTEYCEKRGPESGKTIRLTITTNATLLDADKIEFMDKHMKNCVLSLDGCPDSHNRMRPDAGGNGSYDRTVEGIQRFVKKRGENEYYVRGTFTRHNLNFTRDVLHMASLGFSQLSMEPVVAPDGCGYEIREEDVPTVLAEYEKLARIYVDMRANGKPFTFFHFMMDLDGGPCTYRRMKGCGAGSEYIAVTPDGDIYPCHQFVGETQFKMGNLYDTPVTLDKKLKEDFSQLLVPTKHDCLDCWAKAFCSGGCAANAFHANGTLDSTYEVGCAMQKKRTECALWILAQETKQNATTA